MRSVLASLGLFLATCAGAEEVRMISFNIERGAFSDAELPTIVELMGQVGPADVWAIQEATGGDEVPLLAFVGHIL